MKKVKQVRKNTALKADGKILAFENGVCLVKKITKDIQLLIDAGYLILEDGEDGKSINS